MRDIAEYAKSARAACRLCAAKIEKGQVRLGAVSKGQGGYDVTRWFHPKCYVLASPSSAVTTAASLLGFSALQKEDQTRVSALWSKGPEAVAEAAAGGVRGMEQRARDSTAALPSQSGHGAAAAATAGGRWFGEQQDEGEADGTAAGPHDAKRTKIEGAHGSQVPVAAAAGVPSAAAASDPEDLRPMHATALSPDHPPASRPLALAASSASNPELESQIEALLSSLDPEKAPHSYKGVALPPPWRGAHTVIFHQGPAAGCPPCSRIAAFDFDGCLVNTDVRRMGARAWSLQFPTVPDRLRGFHSEGYKLVVFTNEANIDRFTKARKAAVDSKLGRLDAFMRLVGVPMQVLVACGTTTSKDVFRKPAPGMWRMLEQHLNGGVSVDLQESFYVGDAAGRPQDHSDSDRHFALSAGLRFLTPEEVF